MEHAALGDSPAHYDRLNLDPAAVAPWEDGLRTDPSGCSLEWWYYDCRLEDGTRITVELHTKPPVVPPTSPLMPFVSTVMLRPDGSLLVKNVSIPPDQFAASTAGCDVRMGPNRCRGDISSHEIHVEFDDVKIDLALVSTVAPWRPATGHLFLGEREEKYFAWLPVMPRAQVTGTISKGRHQEHLSGVGYHDHNWGNAAPASIFDHWYWGHAHLGEYTFVGVRAVSHATYGNRTFPAFLFTRGREILLQGASGFDLTTLEEAVEATTGVRVAGKLEYQMGSGETRYRLDFTRRRDVLKLSLGDAAGYLRFVGAAKLECSTRGATTEVVVGDGLWEILSFTPQRGHGVPV